MFSKFWLGESVHLSQRINTKLFLLIRAKEIGTLMFAHLCARCQSKQKDQETSLPLSVFVCVCVFCSVMGKANSDHTL